MQAIPEPLKACPFCGGEAQTILVHDGWAVECRQCAMQAGFDTTEGKAARAWNTRPTPEIGPEQSGELVKFLRRCSSDDEFVPTERRYFAEAADALESAQAEIARLTEALEFYADPGNWFGVYVVGSGAMVDDWSDDCADADFPDGKPGKRARAALSHRTGGGNG